ncbi:MAG: hypothetical protein RI573_19065, partial [Balneolaceae bacterium]|nr:hypothetical protein [Balneolaceae bacterium]
MKNKLKKFIKLVFTIYVGALLLSWGIQYFFPTVDKSNLYIEEQEILANGKQVIHPFYSLDQPKSERTIILIPDLFGGPEFLLPLAHSLRDSFRVIVPEYPKSALDGEDVSFTVKKRSDYIDILTDSLNLDGAHLL